LELEQRQRPLTSHVDLLKTPSEQERQARLRLNLQKPGETTVVVPDAGESDGAPAAIRSAPVEPGLPNPVKWWHYFFS
jgi:hypothetical protein